LSEIIDAPDYLDTIHEHPELCVDFKAWLAKHDLMRWQRCSSFRYDMGTASLRR